MPEPSITAFIINLETDRERRAKMLDQLARLPNIRPTVLRGVAGRYLPTIACETLVSDEGWAREKGTIGCFLSHVMAWELIADLDEPMALVLEDDAGLENLGALAQMSIPSEIDIVFVNERMSPVQDDHGPPRLLPIWYALKKLNSLQGGLGGLEGYLLTPSGAKKLLLACRTDLFFGHVDGRLLRYATTEEDLAELPEDSWIEAVVREHHHGELMPQLGLVSARCLSFPLVWHRALDSTREAENVADPFESE